MRSPGMSSARIRACCFQETRQAAAPLGPRAEPDPTDAQMLIKSLDVLQYEGS